MLSEQKRAEQKHSSRRKSSEARGFLKGKSYPKNPLSGGLALFSDAQQGAIISIGMVFANARAAEILQNSGRFECIKREVDVRWEEGASGHHKVDIWVQEKNKISLIEVHTGKAHNHNTPPEDFDRKYYKALEQVKKEHPAYAVDMFFIGPSAADFPSTIELRQIDTFLSEYAGEPVHFEQEIENAVQKKAVERLCRFSTARREEWPAMKKAIQELLASLP